MTYAIAYSLGLDAANRQMRLAGRTAWGEQDYDLAAVTLNHYLSPGVETSGHPPEAREAEGDTATSPQLRFSFVTPTVSY